MLIYLDFDFLWLDFFFLHFLLGRCFRVSFLKEFIYIRIEGRLEEEEQRKSRLKGDEQRER